MTNINLSKKNILILLNIVFVAFVYFFSNPESSFYFDYTFRMAECFIENRISLLENPPNWLNEFVSIDGRWYTVFPLGAVLNMLPFAAAKYFDIIYFQPSDFIAGLTAASITIFLFLISNNYNLTFRHQLAVVNAMVFGTWFWMNETFGGAWQLALGFAFFGEIAALYFTYFNRKPFLAGVFFSIAFGNRTEVLMTIPVFLYLLNKQSSTLNLLALSLIEKIKNALLFIFVPIILCVSTSIYNYIRFGSFSDFGYSRIVGVLNEYGYRYGIFSPNYIPRQAYEMLLKPWFISEQYPFLYPSQFSSSILISSPFILLTLRRGCRDIALKFSAWIAIILMTLVHWCHGNSGGYQFGYRYAIVILPWIFVLLLESGAKKFRYMEKLMFMISIVLNAYSIYLFYWWKYPNLQML